MKLNTLKSKNRRRSKRVGRGDGSGKGKTSGRGTKGQKSRAGARIRPGFEGGQTPIFQRLPKVRGISRKQPEKTPIVNLYDLEKFFAAGSTVDLVALKKAGMIEKSARDVKILGEGELTKSLTVNVAVSKSAKEKIEKAGGKVISVLKE